VNSTSSLQVLFEDNHCLALAKPAGLLTQGVPAGIPTLEAQAKDYLRECYGKKGNVYLGIPHRLDRPVSGVVLFARSSKAASRLAIQFQEHQIEKVYWAILDGRVEPESGTWEDWLRKLPDEARSVVASQDQPEAKRAVLEFRRLAVSDAEAASWIELKPATGRMHQLRVQSASRGWPVRGDATYGSVRSFGEPADLPRDRSIALHARRLTFLHPIRYEPVTLVAPLPSVWSSLEFPFAECDP
jgi:23S rRNA pseudouridine1911/1915/1917 synthase